MLVTADYLSALRQGKYLLFLQWPDSIVQSDKKDKTIAYAADDLRQLLAFEWLQHGFEPQDVDGVVLLYALLLRENSIRGHLAYAITTMVQVVTQCMAYRHFKIEVGSNQGLSHAEILRLMQENEKQVLMAEFGKVLIAEEEQLGIKSQSVEKRQLDEANAKIRLITDICNELDDYLVGETNIPIRVGESHTPTQEVETDQLKSSRLNVLKRFLSYMNQQTELSEPVLKEMAQYIHTIKQMKPTLREQELLKKIMAPSVLENTLGVIVGYGVTFFKALSGSEEGKKGMVVVCKQ